ncbi:hypothetical protein IPG36_06515 [bacterium]|nr:MAG: hypothetical protein IPG36_06515 [bacterium]
MIDKVYPALDTAAGRSAVDALLEKLFASDFGGSAPAVPVVTPEPAAPAPAPHRKRQPPTLFQNRPHAGCAHQRYYSTSR